MELEQLARKVSRSAGMDCKVAIELRDAYARPPRFWALVYPSRAQAEQSLRADLQVGKFGMAGATDINLLPREMERRLGIALHTAMGSTIAEALQALLQLVKQETRT